MEGKRSVLVTGAYGATEKATVRLLAEKGYRVLSKDRAIYLQCGAL